MVEEQIKQLAEAGVGRVGIPLDLCTEELSERLKGASAGGPCIWEKRLEALENAVQVIGRAIIRFTSQLTTSLKGRGCPLIISAYDYYYVSMFTKDLI